MLVVVMDLVLPLLTKRPVSMSPAVIFVGPVCGEWEWAATKRNRLEDRHVLCQIENQLLENCRVPVCRVPDCTFPHARRTHDKLIPI